MEPYKKECAAVLRFGTRGHTSLWGVGHVVGTALAGYFELEEGNGCGLGPSSLLAGPVKYAWLRRHGTVASICHTLADPTRPSKSVKHTSGIKEVDI